MYTEGGRPVGLADYIGSVASWISTQTGKPVDATTAPPVMVAAGLNVADWYRAAHVDYVMVRF